VLIVYAATNGYIDALPAETMQRYESELFDYVESKHPQALAALREKRELTNEIKTQLNAVLEEFKSRFAA
jgi:F-type H+-transporting ATPase subunit alpha